MSSVFSAYLQIWTGISLTVMTLQSHSRALAIVLITLSYADSTEGTHGTDGEMGQMVTILSLSIPTTPTDGARS